MFDIPVRDYNMQFEQNICMQCGKEKAKYVCDYVIGKTFDLKGKGIVDEVLCDKFICENCRIRINNKDYCKEHYMALKIEINTYKGE